MCSHKQRIRDQFTRQALPFANAPAIRNREALERIVRIADAGPRDTVLDVACGPGLLVCAFATVVEHATGIDLTPAMIEQARREQHKQGLENISWHQGDVLPLPFPDESFSIVTARFAFHHFPDPFPVLLEMRRVCRSGGRVVVADSAPAAEKAAAFNTMERLRDPSHVRAMPAAEITSLFEQAGLDVVRVDSYRLDGEVEDLLSRSFPNDGDADRVREMFKDSLTTDAMDMAVHLSHGKTHYGFPVAIVAALKNSA
jgi:ubiquinone/menaquinone biosynthesis C-methylase UbiE